MIDAITKLIIIRHGEAEGNHLRIFQGWTDGDLTEKGHLQAKLLAERIKHIEISTLYSSTLTRALKTAEYIAREKKLDIKLSTELKEINGGDWEGKPWNVLPEKWPYQYDTWENRPHEHRMPNGESTDELSERIFTEIESIISENIGQTVCIVTHGTVIRTLLHKLHGYPPEKLVEIPWHDNTAMSVIEYNNNNYKILVEGDASHLSDEQSTLKNQEWWLSINGIKEDS